MNKRDRDQLRASIAKDLVQGQGPPSPTRELLKHYSPLEGIVTAPETDDSLREAPVENTSAPGATLAQDAPSAWHRATVARHSTLAPHATVERYAIVKGELRVPNTLNFSVFPTLDPFARAVYYQLFLLSHGFRRDTCLVSLAKLAKSVLMSQRKVQNTIVYLEKRGLSRSSANRPEATSTGFRCRVPEWHKMPPWHRGPLLHLTRIIHERKGPTSFWTQKNADGRRCFEPVSACGNLCRPEGISAPR